MWLWVWTWQSYQCRFGREYGKAFNAVFYVSLTARSDLYTSLFSTPSFLLKSRPHPQRGTADAEVKVPSVGEPRAVKFSPLKAWSRSDYSHAFFAHSQKVLPFKFLPSRSIQLHLFQIFSPLLPGLKCGLCRFPSSRAIDEGSCVECLRNENRLQSMC